MPVPQPLPVGYHGVRRNGRPSLLTPQVTEEFERYMRAGNYFETVSDYMGIERTTSRGWMKRGAREHRRLETHPEAEVNPSEAQFRDFYIAIRGAMAASEMSDLAVIGTAAQGRPRRVIRRTHPDGTVEEITEEAIAPNWNAASWRLARKRPMRFAQQAPIKVQHSGGKGGDDPIHVDHTGQVTFYLPDNGRGTPAGGPITEDNNSQEE